MNNTNEILKEAIKNFKQGKMNSNALFNVCVQSGMDPVKAQKFVDRMFKLIFFP